MKNSFSFKNILLALCLIVFFSCEEILNDCIFWPNKPEIETQSIASGHLNQPFNRTIRCGVKNNPSDSSFEYDIQLIGNLPAGVTYTVQGRELILSGTPTEMGSFTITIEVSVYGYNSDSEEYDDEKFCFGNNIEFKEFTFQIEAL